MCVIGGGVGAGCKGRGGVGASKVVLVGVEGWVGADCATGGKERKAATHLVLDPTGQGYAELEAAVAVPGELVELMVVAIWKADEAVVVLAGRPTLGAELMVGM